MGNRFTSKPPGSKHQSAVGSRRSAVDIVRARFRDFARGLFLSDFTGGPKGLTEY